jgi:hypothetical protein
MKACPARLTKAPRINGKLFLSEILIQANESALIPSTIQWRFQAFYFIKNSRPSQSTRMRTPVGSLTNQATLHSCGYSRVNIEDFLLGTNLVVF